MCIRDRANIAHQLKTPITAAFLSLQLMEKEIPGAYAEQVKQQLKRLNRLEAVSYTHLDVYKRQAGVLLRLRRRDRRH